MSWYEAPSTDFVSLEVLKSVGQLFDAELFAKCQGLGRPLFRSSMLTSAVSENADQIFLSASSKAIRSVSPGFSRLIPRIVGKGYAFQDSGEG